VLSDVPAGPVFRFGPSAISSASAARPSRGTGARQAAAARVSPLARRRAVSGSCRRVDAAQSARSVVRSAGHSSEDGPRARRRGLGQDLRRAGLGVFAGPDVIEDEVRKRYHVQVVGRATRSGSSLRISLERKIKHPAVVAICEVARKSIFT